MKRLRTPVWVLLSYALVALALSWPLPAHLTTHITGEPAGDAGVYVWNHWVFHHEVTAGSGLPYSTDRILASSGGANLGLHNYTTFQNLIALPLIPMTGVVAAFNIVYLLMTVLAAFAMFHLARRVTGGTAESWLAGLLFAWSPLMVARGTGHFSLVAAAPLVVFLLLLLRIVERPRLLEAAALGATLAWAASADVYYAVYCVMMAAFALAAQVVSVSRREARPLRLVRLLDILIVCVLAGIAAIVLTGGGQFNLLGLSVRVNSLYTPVLVLTTLVGARMACASRVRFAGITPAGAAHVARLALAGGLVAAVLMAPMLSAAAPLLTDASHAQRVLWRSSPTGANLLAFVLPSPMHPLAPEPLVRWVNGLPGGFIENVVAVPLIVFGVLAGAWRAGWTPPRWWLAFTLLAGSLALGPFIQLGPFNTHVPGPWALLRYVPVIELARAPQRFAVVMTIGIAVLFAAALCWIGRAHPQRRRILLAASGFVLLVELLPAPRLLYPSGVPGVYRHVAAAPGDGRVLELPIGVRDGTLSVGDFIAHSQVFQTAHGHPLLGGYVSRVPPRQVEQLRKDEVLNPLLMLSEGDAITAEQEAAVLSGAAAFLSRANVEFVVIDRRRASPQLAGLAIRAFRLQLVDTDRHYELYRPGTPTS